MGANAVLEAHRGCSPPRDHELSGWIDWAEWVEPVERSLAAVSSSALTERLVRLFGESSSPADTHVVVLVDVGSPADADAASHLVRVATMAELRAHFPFVDAVAAISATRYAVLARRHPGLAGTVTSLEDRLRDESVRLDAVAAVWCEELPGSAHDVPAFVRGIHIKTRPARQPDRGLLATGLPVEILAGGPPCGSTAGSARREPGETRWARRSTAAALVMAVLASGAGTAATVGRAVVPPLRALRPGSGAATTALVPSAGAAASGAVSVLGSAPSSSLFDQLLGLLQGIEPGPITVPLVTPAVRPAPEATVLTQSGSPPATATPSLPEAPEPTAPTAPAPEAPATPTTEEPTPPEPPVVPEVVLPDVPEDLSPDEPPSEPEPLLGQLTELVSGLLDG